MYINNYYFLHCMFSKFFYPRINKPNMHNNIDISSFWNGLNHPFGSTGFYLRAKLQKIIRKWKNNLFFIFQVIFLEVYIFKDVTFFSRLVHCVKSARIRSFSAPYFPVSRLNTEKYSISLRNQSEWGKIRTRKTLNTDTFHEVVLI